MLTRLRIRNFKRFDDVDIELGQAVVFIGPNNSGKTTALQALALWELGLRRWLEKRKDDGSRRERPGVAINRRDLFSVPVPAANLLWREMHVRDVRRVDERQQTNNVRVEIVVDGIVDATDWSCGLEFDYANEESFYCRPLRTNGGTSSERMPVPSECQTVRVAYLPPMSGLADREFVKQPGEIGVLTGQGQTAQVLRNLCYSLHRDSEPEWRALVERVKDLFGAELMEPGYVAERSEVTLAYREEGRREAMDISASGRGLQQTLLLLAHLYRNPGSALLLDEPDAHLEALRQRQTYTLIKEVAQAQGAQVIAASHSEVVLNEAAERDVVVAFVGKPHRIARGFQARKALTDIGFDQYLQAEQTGWALYLENSSDLEILKTFAKTLDHRAARWLERPFFHAVATNLPQRARDHFFGLREAKQDLVGIAIFDRLERNLATESPLRELMWQKREIENYLCREDVLIAYARGGEPDSLFAAGRVEAMQDAIRQIANALRTLGKPDPWSPDIKVTDEFLDPLFRIYFEKLRLRNTLGESNYYVLAQYIAKDRIDPEIIAKLDAIVEVAESARPRSD